MFEYFILSSLIFLIILSSTVIILLLRSRRKKEENSIRNLLEDYEKNQLLQGESLKRQEDSLTRLTNDIQSFQEPLNKLRNYLSGGTKAGQFGEWSLEAIIGDVFPENLFKKNAEIVSGSGERVEFAIKLPEGLLMPIDAKFSSGLFDNYLEASKSGDKDKVDKIKNEIKRRAIQNAKDISEKYIQTGVTTDLAVMFIPSENIQQLIDSLGIREQLFRDFRVLMLGPNSLAAYLISLHMGFRNIALNDRAKEIIIEFGKLKKEFENFSHSTEDLRKKAEAMLKAIDSHETRERQMSRSIDRIDSLD